MRVLFFLLLLHGFGARLFAQGDLQILSEKILPNGIFVRSMRNDYIDSEEKSKFLSLRKKDAPINIPKPKNTYNFFRFSELMPDSSSTKELIYLGVVFMSHTYFEEKFDSLFNTPEKFQSCTNGYYMFCKVFQTRGGRTKVNIYPDFSNYCTAKQHTKFDFSSEPYHIKNGSKCKDLEEHLSKLKALMRIRDHEAEDLWKVDEITTLKGGKKNFIKEFLTKGKTSHEFKINFEKFIKSFQINFDVDNNQANKIIGLTLDYTKYGRSTDKSEQTRYSYDFRCDKSINWMGTYNAFIGTYKSINRPNESQLDAREAPLSYTIENENGKKVIKLVGVKHAPFGCIDTKTHSLETIEVNDKKTGWVFAGNYGNFKNADNYVLLTNPVLNHNQFQDFVTATKAFMTLKNVFLYDKLPIQQGNENEWIRGHEIGIIDKYTAINVKKFQICADKIANKLSIWLEVEY